MVMDGIKEYLLAPELVKGYQNAGRLFCLSVSSKSESMKRIVFLY